MLDAFGIINMGGRIAKAKAVERFAAGKKCRCCAVLRDASLGRVLQADPFVQGPTNSQSYNRYTYVFNNPLSFTDPSGFITLRQVIGIVAAIVVGYFLGPFATTLWKAFWVGFATGFISGLIITGNFKSALKSGLISGAIAGIGFAVGNGGASAAEADAAVSGGVGGQITANGFESSNTISNSAPSSTGRALDMVSEQGSQSVATSVGSSVEEGILDLGSIQVAGGLATCECSLGFLRQEALLTGSTFQIMNDMRDAFVESFANDLSANTVNSFRRSFNDLHDLYSDVGGYLGRRAAFWGGVGTTVSVATMLGPVGFAKGVAGKLLFGAGGKAKVFWTGGKEQFTSAMVKQKATEFARANGAVTIEMTMGGKALVKFESMFSKVIPEKTMYKLWKSASASFAKNTTGTANVFQSIRGVGVNSIWATAEFVNLPGSVKLIYQLVRF